MTIKNDGSFENTENYKKEELDDLKVNSIRIQIPLEQEQKLEAKVAGDNAETPTELEKDKKHVVTNKHKEVEIEMEWKFVTDTDEGKIDKLNNVEAQPDKKQKIKANFDKGNGNVIVNLNINRYVNLSVNVNINFNSIVPDNIVNQVNAQITAELEKNVEVNLNAETPINLQERVNLNLENIDSGAVPDKKVLENDNKVDNKYKEKTQLDYHQESQTFFKFFDALYLFQSLFQMNAISIHLFYFIVFFSLFIVLTRYFQGDYTHTEYFVKNNLVEMFNY